MPADVHEDPGQGIAGSLDGHRVLVGSRAFMRANGVRRRGARRDGIDELRAAPARRTSLVAIDGRVAGVIVMADELRPDAVRIVERLRTEGVRHVAMISGDRRSVAERVGREARHRPRLRRAVRRGQARDRPKRIAAEPGATPGDHGRRRDQRRAGARDRRPRDRDGGRRRHRLLGNRRRGHHRRPRRSRRRRGPHRPSRAPYRPPERARRAWDSASPRWA